MYDASKAGFGVVHTEADSDLVAKTGRCRERFRFAPEFRQEGSLREASLAVYPQPDDEGGDVPVTSLIS